MKYILLLLLPCLIWGKMINLIKDGSFENTTQDGISEVWRQDMLQTANYNKIICSQDFVDWQHFNETEGIKFCRGFSDLAPPPKSGKWLAWFEGYPFPSEGILQQSIEIPQDTSGILEFSYMVLYVGRPSNSYLDVRLNNEIIATFDYQNGTKLVLENDTIIFPNYRTFIYPFEKLHAGKHYLTFTYISPMDFPIKPSLVEYFVDDISFHITEDREIKFDSWVLILMVIGIIFFAVSIVIFITKIIKKYRPSSPIFEYEQIQPSLDLLDDEEEV